MRIMISITNFVMYKRKSIASPEEALPKTDEKTFPESSRDSLAAIISAKADSTAPGIMSTADIPTPARPKLPYIPDSETPAPSPRKTGTKSSMG